MAKRPTKTELKKQESPRYKVVENDDGYVEVTFRLPRRFYDWFVMRAEAEGTPESQWLERLVRQTWAQCPIRRARGATIPADQFKG